MRMEFTPHPLTSQPPDRPIGQSAAGADGRDQAAVARESMTSNGGRECRPEA